MTFCLESTIIKPEKDKDINNVVVLLHGYGGDGKDISMLKFEKVYAKYTFHMSKWTRNLFNKSIRISMV